MVRPQDRQQGELKVQVTLNKTDECNDNVAPEESELG